MIRILLAVVADSGGIVRIQLNGRLAINLAGIDQVGPPLRTVPERIVKARRFRTKVGNVSPAVRIDRECFESPAQGIHCGFSPALPTFRSRSVPKSRSGPT